MVCRPKAISRQFYCETDQSRHTIIIYLMNSNYQLLSFINFLVNPGSQFIYQTISGKSHTYGYSIHFQLNTEPSNFDDVASRLFYDMIGQLCDTITPNQNQASVLKHGILRHPSELLREANATTKGV